MKQFTKILYALPALLMAACSAEDNVEQAKETIRTYTMIGDTGDMTRVSYEDISNTMYCDWEMGDIVTLKNTSDQSFDFTVTSIDGNGVATLNYVGYIPDSDNFTGTATYAPRDNDKAGIQTVNNSTDHLKYGETMVAELTNQKIDGSKLTFTHPETAVYKVIFKAPAAFESSTLTMTGAWEEDSSTKLHFSTEQDDVVTAFVIHKGGQLNAGDKLKFILDIEDGNCFSYTFSSVNSFTYENGKYWIANFANKDMDWEGIDLGLSVKWAACNLGASVPGERGTPYAWGETETKTSFTNGNYRWADIYNNGPFEELRSSGIINSDITAEYDAATQVLGSKWRMPEDFEASQLMSKCTITKAQCNGQDGVKVTGPNGNSIFLPNTGYRDNGLVNIKFGYYWTSSVCRSESKSYGYFWPYYIEIDTDTTGDPSTTVWHNNRDGDGRSAYQDLFIRPVTAY